MSVFDNLICECELPVEGLEGVVFQTKSTPNQFCDLFKIGKDKQLYEEKYDTVDRSDPDATGIAKLGGFMTQVNKRFERSEFTGEIRFYTSLENIGWIEFSAYFIKGCMKHLVLIEQKP